MVGEPPSFRPALALGMTSFLLVLAATGASAPVAAQGPADPILELYFCVWEGEDCNLPVCPGGVQNCQPNPCDPECPQVCDPDCGQLVDQVRDELDESDLDDDGVPDEVERQLCGREIIRNQVNDNPELGQCATPSNYVKPGIPPIGPLPPLGPWIELVQETVGDNDHDNVPDALEPTMCAIEDENSNVDGHCVGNNYFP